LPNPSTFPAAYRAYETLVAPARAQCEIWRLVAGIVAVVFLYFFGLRVYVNLVAWVLSVPVWTVDVGLPRAALPVWVLALLFSFSALVLATVVVTRTLHARPALSLLGPAKRAFRDFARVAGAVLLLILVLEILPPWDPWSVSRNAALPISTWLLVLPLSLSGVLVQAGSEELFFRGYLQSQLAARFRSPVVWMALPAIFFAALHYDPATNGVSALWVVVWAGAFAFFASDLTARTGNLGAAIGFHFVNNIYAILFVSFQGPLDGLALYHLPYSAADMEPSSPIIFLEFAAMITAWLAARLAVQR